MEDPGLLGKHCLPRHPDGVRSLTTSLHFAFQAVQTFHVPRDHNQYHRVDGKNPDVKKELEKVLLVPLTHAVIDPRTMVVHSPNAPLAYSAVMGPAKSKRKLLHFIWNFQQYMIFLKYITLVADTFHILCKWSNRRLEEGWQSVSRQLCDCR